MEQVLTYILSGTGIVTFLAAAAVFLRGSADRGTITSLQNSVNALQTAGTLKDQEIETLKANDKAKDAEISRLNVEVAALRRTIGAQAEIAHLQETVDAFRIESLAGLQEIKEAVS